MSPLHSDSTPGSNPFLTFIKPVLAIVDDGTFFRRPFEWLYRLLAIVNLIIPAWLLYQAIDNDLFDLPFKLVIAFAFIWLGVAFAGWVAFQLWWDRAGTVAGISKPGEDFVATPSFAHFIQTSGEWTGSWLAIVGFDIAIVTWLFDQASYITDSMGLGSMDAGPASLLIAPVTGFLIIVSTRFLAEQVRALAAIANNTRRS